MAENLKVGDQFRFMGSGRYLKIASIIKRDMSVRIKAERYAPIIEFLADAKVYVRKDD